MTPFITRLRSFSTVAAGSTATLEVPRTGTYHQITLAYTESGTLAAEADIEGGIDEIRLNINGKTQWRLTPAQLFDINRFWGKTFQTGFLPLYFAPPWMRTAQGEEQLAWGMDDVASFQIEVDVAAAATSPGLTATAIKTPERRDMGQVRKFLPYTVPVAGTGLTQFDWTRQDTYAAIHNFSGDIDDVEVKIDNVEQFDVTLAEINQYSEGFELSPQSNVFHIPFGLRRRFGDALPMVIGSGQDRRRVAEFMVDYNMSAANSFTAIAETVGFRN